MKTHILFIAGILFSSFIFAQEESGSVTKLKKSDRIMFDLYYDLWQNVPSNITLKTIQYGLGVTSMQDFPIGTSNFAFAYGIGISAHNMHSNAIITYDTLKNTQLVSLPNDLEYKVNKLALTYVNIPVELRFRTKGVNSFKFYAGFRFGLLLQEHTKYVGKDPLDSEQMIKYKEFKHRNMCKLQYGPTVRIGYKWISAYASYSMRSIFVKDKGPQMYPISFGISLMPY